MHLDLSINEGLIGAGNYCHLKNKSYLKTTYKTLEFDFCSPNQPSVSEKRLAKAL